jgi:hypothetical protein
MFGTSPSAAEVNETAHSPDQLSVMWINTGSVTTAWPTMRAGSNAWEIDVEHFASDYNLGQQIDLRRGVQTGALAVSQQTNFLTQIPEFSERTRILALAGDQLALSDDELSRWLISAEQQVLVGTDNHPLFETSLDDTACVIRRLPNGLVAMTEVPRAHVLAARERLRTILGDRITSYVSTCIETPIRTIARYFLTAVKEGELVQRAGKESEVTAFVMIGTAGFRFGLWSPAAGLFSEYGFIAPKEISQLSDRSPDAGRVEAYARQAFEQLELQLSKEKLEQLQLSGYAQVVWIAEPSISNTIAQVAAEHATQTGIQAFHLDTVVDEAVVAGLLLGSFAFGDATPYGAVVLPQANLARDLLVLADTEANQRRFSEEVFAKRRRGRAVFTMLAPPIAMVAILLAMLAGLILSQLFTAVRDSRAEAKTLELKPALDRRNSYEANLKWYQEFIKQVSRLRKQQPAGISLLYQLNSDYPFAVDPSFYVSDMKLLPTGAVEMKGYARNKDAVASFLKSLEFAGGPESGSRLFANLAYEVQEGAPQVVTATGQTQLPTMAGSTLGANQIRPGVIVWSIKGSYLPAQEFAPKPDAKPGATPVAPQALASPAKPAGQ